MSEILNKTYDRLKKLYPVEFQRLQNDPEKKKSLESKLKKSIETERKLVEIFRGKLNEDISGESIATSMSKCLPADRIKLIRNAFQFETYTIDIIECDGSPWVTITRADKELFPSRELNTLENVSYGDALQDASITVEIVLLVLNAVGIGVHLSDEEIEGIAKAVEDIMDKPDIKKALDDLKAAFKGKSTSEEAEDIFHFIEALDRENALWDIIKKICSGMKWYEWIETAAEVAAMIIATIGTDGAALIAKIALSLVNAVKLGLKFDNSAKFAAIKGQLRSSGSYCVCM